MITQRQEEILKIIVDEYTKTAFPVGSKKIVELMVDKISSATIRNECAILEELELLEKQHTSSGRIPSSTGYRYYVDHLMIDADFDKSIYSKIDEIFSHRDYSIDEIVSQSSQIISELTNLTAIISKKDEFGQLAIRHVELVSLNNNSGSVIFILSNGEVVKKVYNFAEDQLNDLKIAISLFNDTLIDTKITDLNENLNSAQDDLKDMIKGYEDIFHQFIKAVLEQTKPKTETFGINNMLINPEFSDIEKIKNVMAVIASISPFDWFDYNYRSSKRNIEITTKIGMEINPNMQEVSDLAIIGAEFEANAGQKNMITLIGPKRMRYDEANILLKFLINKINGLNET